MTGVLAGEVIDRLLNVEIDVTTDGRVTLHYDHELQNLTHTPFTRMSRQFWFKHTSGPLIVEATPSDDRNVLIQRVHQVGVQVKFACQIFPAIGAGETAKVGYSCTGGQFADELYWRQSVFRPTKELHLRLRLHGVEALTGCSAVEERPDGSELTATESLTWHRDKDGIVIDLTRRDLRSNQAVTLCWDVARATA